MTPIPKRHKAEEEVVSPGIVTCNNFIGGKDVPPVTGEYLNVLSPSDGTSLGKVALSGPDDVEMAVKVAEEALPAWSGMTAKTRAAVMFRFRALMESHADELADLVVVENGKNKAEALASVAKGNETVEWACSMPQLMQGVAFGSTALHPVGTLTHFNREKSCKWTVPIALTAGNCVILKPSEKVPLTMWRVARLFAEAGVPPGVFQIVNGAAATVVALCDSPGVSALTFVGSSGVARSVAEKCHKSHKRVLALGGAENHLIALPDCDMEAASHDIVASFAGCAGQRCMAASVLVLVGETGALLDKVVAKAKALQPGTAAGQVGPVINAMARDHIVSHITKEEKLPGCEILLDGRPWADKSPGTWLGPTIVSHSAPPVTGDENGGSTPGEEVFGPVLKVVKVGTWQEALAVENASTFGNAASVYTSSGAAAEYFQTQFKAGMIGVNIGIPVPREPFSFGGLYGTRSKYGDFDITGDGAMEFFTNRRKITTKWNLPQAEAGAGRSGSDQASFVGQI